MTKDDILKWLKNQILSLAAIVFLAGGAWYLLPERIETNREVFDSHIEHQFRPLRNQVNKNTNSIQEVESNYQSLERLIKQQNANEDKRYKRLESRLDYIIKRLDNDTR